MKNFPLITKYIDEIGIDVNQSDRLFLQILEAKLKEVESGRRLTVDDAVGETYDTYSEAMDNSYDDY
jgi:hypothetical protein